MKLLKFISVLMALHAMEFSTESEVEQLLKGANLTEKQLSKKQIQNIARLMTPKILKDQGIILKKNYDKILHKLKDKNQLFMVTHLLNAKDFLKLSSLNKEYFEMIGGNLEKLQSHLNCDFIDDFPIYFTLPFPDNTLSVMEYFHMFCLHFGTEMSYSPQFVDYLHTSGNKIYKIDESSLRLVISGNIVFDIGLLSGEIHLSIMSKEMSLRDFKISGDDPIVWEKDGHLYSASNENIKRLLYLGTNPIDFKNKLIIPKRIESNDYKVCMCITPANFRKSCRQFPLLNWKNLGKM